MDMDSGKSRRLHDIIPRQKERMMLEDGDWCVLQMQLSTIHAIR